MTIEEIKSFARIRFIQLMGDVQNNAPIVFTAQEIISLMGIPEMIEQLEQKTGEEMHLWRLHFER